jgi:hypothetical protein
LSYANEYILVLGNGRTLFGVCKGELNKFDQPCTHRGKKRSDGLEEAMLRGGLAAYQSGGYTVNHCGQAPNSVLLSWAAGVCMVSGDGHCILTCQTVGSAKYCIEGRAASP